MDLNVIYNMDCLIGSDNIESDSTAVACINTNRFFIGYEMDGKYFDIATNRIQEHTRQMAIV